MTRGRRAAASIALLAGGLAGCAEAPAPTPPPPVPTERMTVIAAETPWIGAPRPSKEAIEVGFPGQLVHVLKPMPSMKWKADMGGKKGEREGAMIEARYAKDDGLLYGFASDMGEEIDAPAASFLCAAIGRELAAAGVANERCEGMLRRVRAPDGSFVAYVPCFVGPCAVAKIAGGRVAATTIVGLTDARPVLVPGGLVLFARARSSEHEGHKTGGRIAVIGFAGEAPVVLGVVATDEADARDPAAIRTRSATVEIASPGTATASLHVSGEVVTLGADGHELARTPFDETYAASATGLERAK